MSLLAITRHWRSDSRDERQGQLEVELISPLLSSSPPRAHSPLSGANLKEAKFQ